MTPRGKNFGSYASFLIETVPSCYFDPSVSCLFGENFNLNRSHPWLIYAELMHSPDSRAHEAAEQLMAQFIK